MSFQTVCDLCARVINEKDPALWHLDFERNEIWHDLSGELHFCQDCVKDVLFPKVQKYMEELRPHLALEGK